MVKRWYLLFIGILLLLFLGFWLNGHWSKDDVDENNTIGVDSSPTIIHELYVTSTPYSLVLPSLESKASATPIPSPSPTATFILSPTVTPLGCWNQAGKIEKSQLSSTLLRLPLEFRVYLPPCYDKQPDRRYPVLYLIHGSSFNDDQWERLGVGVTSDALIAAGIISPYIVVMPRDREWTQPTVDKFGEALIQSLIPWIDGNYRTLSDRSHRAIGGLSRGGAWAVHLGLSHWELFGTIGAHSLAVFDTDAPYYINQWLEALPRDALPRIYLDIGDHDREIIFKSAVWFESRLTESGIPHEWHLNIGSHDEAYWKSHVEDYIRWYTQDW
jgi:enterochelin esterase-like enzyme